MIQTADQRLSQSLKVNSKSIQEGVTNYTGNIKLSAGPWRADIVTNSRYSEMSGMGHYSPAPGNIHVRGILGLFGATADVVTLNTESGELQLAGRVHLDGWEQSRDLQSCTILRTEEIRP